MTGKPASRSDRPRHSFLCFRQFRCRSWLREPSPRDRNRKSMIPICVTAKLGMGLKGNVIALVLQASVYGLVPHHVAEVEVFVGPMERCPIIREIIESKRESRPTACM
jgi:hypothetical protein